jgi:hypothetical protein
LEDVDVTRESPPPAPAEKATTRRKPVAKKKSPLASTRARTKSAAKARTVSARREPEIWRDALSTRASAAGARIARLSEGGAAAARRALERVRGLSKKTAKRLSRDWQKMDTRRRTQLVATLVAALGAAAAPLVARQLKKR